MRLVKERRTRAKAKPSKSLEIRSAAADWFKRQKADEKAVQEVENSVKAIINQVKENGDDALDRACPKI